jgi:putative hydrolase of the HAD superfamily
VTLDDVVDRAGRIARAVVGRRDETHVEIPWAAAFRLIYDHFGFEFDEPLDALELGYWVAAVHTGPLPGVRDALNKIAALGVQMAVVSNTSFSASVLRFELDRHGLANHLAFIVSSADYAVRKPNVVLFKLAATRLHLAPESIWFLGDRLETDVAGANLAGMTSVWLSGRPPEGEEMEIRADLTVPDWTTLAQRVERLGSRA